MPKATVNPGDAFIDTKALGYSSATEQGSIDRTWRYDRSFTITYPYDRIEGVHNPLNVCPTGTVTLLPVYKTGTFSPCTQPRVVPRPHHVSPASVVYMDTHVLVLIDTDQIPKILRQPECMCPSTEAPVARHLFLRSIPEFRASNASDRRSPLDPQCVVGIFLVDSGKKKEKFWIEIGNSKNCLKAIVMYQKELKVSVSYLIYFSLSLL